jgi:putative ABC transport system ATP-binding protein
LIKKTDHLVDTYVNVRKARFGILIRQYLGSLGWQAIVHSGLIATAGWLLGIGQLTLGQFVAAEVVVSGILSSFDGVVKRMGHIYYFLTALDGAEFLVLSSRKTRIRRPSPSRCRTRPCTAFASPAKI